MQEFLPIVLYLLLGMLCCFFQYNIKVMKNFQGKEPAAYGHSFPQFQNLS